MDTATLVDHRSISDGQRLLDQLASEDFSVRAACWIKLQNRFKPSLFIATALVDQKGPVEAYRELHRVFRSLDGLWLETSDVSLVGENHPLVHDVQAVCSRHREGLLPPDVSMFGGMAVDEVYVYPTEVFPGFSQIKQKFPSAEPIVLNLPGDPALPPNWGFHPTIQSLLRKVNTQEFEGKPPETLYFAGLAYSQLDHVKRLYFAFRPEGWNTMYDRKSKEWRRVVFAETSQPALYEPADFSPLLELKS